MSRSSLEELDSRHEVIDEAATEAGRDPTAIRRMLNIGGTITNGASDGSLNGPPDQWVEKLTDLTRNHGFDTYIFWPRST